MHIQKLKDSSNTGNICTTRVKASIYKSGDQIKVTNSLVTTVVSVKSLWGDK